MRVGHGRQGLDDLLLGSPFPRPYHIRPANLELLPDLISLNPRKVWMSFNPRVSLTRDRGPDEKIPKSFPWSLGCDAEVVSIRPQYPCDLTHHQGCILFSRAAAQESIQDPLVKASLEGIVWKLHLSHVVNLVKELGEMGVILLHLVNAHVAEIGIDDVCESLFFDQGNLDEGGSHPDM